MLLGKKTIRTPKKKKKKTRLTCFLMAKCYQVGFLDPNEAGQGSPRLDHVRSGLYKFVVRDGQDGGSDRSPGRGVAG